MLMPPSASLSRIFILNKVSRNRLNVFRNFTYLFRNGSYTQCCREDFFQNQSLTISTRKFFNARQMQVPGDDKKPRKRSMPPLMDFPEILWPSALKSIKNWILIQFIIRPYFDNDFNLRDFIYGAKRALQVISTKLGKSDVDSLKSMVSDEATTKLKQVLETLSVSQRQQLEVKEEDVYLSFPYQIGIMFDESNEKTQKRWVEITVVFHVLRGFRQMRQEDVPWNLGILPEYQDKVFVCNYRFIKEFTQGEQSEWTVNIVNHFKPVDLLIEP